MLPMPSKSCWSIQESHAFHTLLARSTHVQVSAGRKVMLPMPSKSCWSIQESHAFHTLLARSTHVQVSAGSVSQKPAIILKSLAEHC